MTFCYITVLFPLYCGYGFLGTGTEYQSSFYYWYRYIADPLFIIYWH